jgi:hypothetical protein
MRIKIDTQRNVVWGEVATSDGMYAFFITIS